MKKIKLLTLLLSLFTLVVLTESCDKAEELLDPCASVTCQNDGVCVDGNCDCPDGYIGTNCENFDASQVQALLANHTPIDLVNGGVPLDSLYGKMYEGGLIFYLNTDTGSGIVAATEDQSTGAEWGCYGTDIMDLNNVPYNNGAPEGLGSEIGDGKANTDAILAGCMPNDGIAAELCREKGSEWFLPSIKELGLMYTNLKDNGDLGGFAAGVYWSSTENDGNDAWLQYFNDGLQLEVFGKVNVVHVRAARAF